MPIWMASPPEVHSALLSSGPGIESLISAAGALDSLCAEYASAAEELDGLLAAVQAGAWQGPSTESYVAAHVPYLAWLMQASADSATAAASHETAAAAYLTALAAMPTLAELAANHAVHAVLVATNFFGINTIPIALNEADYARMWIQAASAMTTYQTVSSTAVASTPQPAPAPRIVKAANNSGGSHDEGPGPTDPNWWAERIGKVITAFENELTNPNSANGQVLYSTLTYWIPRWSGEVYLTFAPQLTQLSELSFGLIAPAFMGGLAGTAGLAGLSQSAPTSMPAGPVVAAPIPSEIGPVAGMTPTLGAPAAPPATAPAPVPASAAAPAPTAAPPSSPPAVGAESFGYPYLVGPPGVGSGSSMSIGTGAKRGAPEPDTAAAAADAAAAGEQVRRRRRAGQLERGHRHEYLESDSSVAASDRGGGALGFAGTAQHPEAGQAAGLTTLAGDALGGGPAMPMMPSTWSVDADESGK